MAKMGIIHDYDLMANAEESAQKQAACVVCGASPILYQWSDYSGEAMCTRCGCQYQLKWGNDEQVKDGKYPYLNLRDDFLPFAVEFWKAKRLFVHYGMSFNRHDGKGELAEWMATAHPEFK